jgi:hypothetical protein
MHTDMLTNVLLVAAAVAMVAGLWYKPTRMVLLVAFFLGGIALNSTLYLAFIGVPLMLVSGFLLLTEYLQRTAPAPLPHVGPGDFSAEHRQHEHHKRKRKSEADPYDDWILTDEP